MKTRKQIFAVAGIIILLLLYIVTFISALFKSPAAQQLFRACLGCTILIPVFLYLVLMVARVVKPQKSPVIDTIVFDLGGVLVEFAWEEYAMKMGASKEDARYFKEHIVGSPAFEKLDTGLYPLEEVTEGLCTAFPEYADTIRPVFASLWDACLPLWYTDSWISALRRQGYKVYFLSNWNREVHAHLMESGLLRFTERMDGGIWSFEEHCIKPDPKIFRLLRDRFGADPSRTLFIDDTARNVEAARKEGFAALLFSSYPDAEEEMEKLGIRWVL